jgi:hypothetical protein
MILIEGWVITEQFPLLNDIELYVQLAGEADGIRFYVRE